MRLIPLLSVLFLVVGVKTDDYIDEVQGRCFATNRSYTCAKYELFRYIDDFHLGNVSLTSDSSVKFVNIPSDNASVPLLGRGRYFPKDSEFLKILKFFKRRAMKFVNEQAVSWELPEGVDVVEESGVSTGRKKEKKSLILPILILIKLCKVKIIASLILMGVVVIKKMLLGAAFILPGVVAAIKHHCKAQQFHVVPYHVDEEHYSHSHNHESDHDSTGYGITGIGGDKHYWDKRKRFSYF